MRQRLDVWVNDELVLDAGFWSRTRGPHGKQITIHPPQKSLFHQVLDYLREKPDPPQSLSGSMIGREGIAAAALTVRWGSYFAVLADLRKPIWSEVEFQGTSRIADSEMARINIEVSAAFAEWIDLFRSGPEMEYERLVNRAVFYLPMPQKTSVRSRDLLMVLGAPELSKLMVQTAHPDRIDHLNAQCESASTRMFANAVVNVAWRNGPVEDIHAGAYKGYPLDKRRITPAEEHTLMTTTSSKFADAMWACFGFKAEVPQRRWIEQIAPYVLNPFIAPSNWTLTEESSVVQLPTAVGKNERGS